MVEVDRKELGASLKSVRSGVASRAGIPALTGIRVTVAGGQVTLVATDLQTWTSAYVANRGHVGDSWTALVPAKPFAEAVTASKGDLISLSYEEVGSAVFVTVGQVKLRCLDVADFPAHPDAHSPNLYLNVTDFADTLEAVSLAVHTDEVRPVLCGVCWEVRDKVLTLIATDSYRLHIAELAPGAIGNALGAVGDRRVIVRSKPVLAEAKRERSRANKRNGNPLATVGVYLPDENDTNGFASFTFPNKVTVTVQRTVGEFPNWRQLVPDAVPNGYGSTMDANPADIVEAVKLVRVALDEGQPVKLHLNDEVRLQAGNPTTGEASTVIESATWRPEEAGTHMVTAFNPDFLLDALKATDGWRWEIRDGLKPAVLRGANKRTALLMPVRMPAS